MIYGLDSIGSSVMSDCDESSHGMIPLLFPNGVNERHAARPLACQIDLSMSGPRTTEPVLVSYQSPISIKSTTIQHTMTT